MTGIDPGIGERLGLIADVGGTNVRFALIDATAHEPRLLAPQRYLTADFPGIVEAASAYLKHVGTHAGTHLGSAPRYGAFAVAGVVREPETQITNCPWRFSTAAARHALQLETLCVVNDFEALALAIPALKENEQITIGTQLPPQLRGGGTIAVLGPGTGLGVSALRLNGGDPIVVTSEGGHASLAPTTDEEIEVLRCLRQRFGRVSYERVLSGQGLSNLHSALCALNDCEGGRATPEQITQRARAGEAMSVKAVEQFCAWLGAFAGDTALMFGAWQGIYLAGGLVGALTEPLARSAFRERFEDKGRLSATLSGVASVAVLRTDLGLAGAASALKRHLNRS